jgi:exosortase A-associated hydrolase 2
MSVRRTAFFLPVGTAGQRLCVLTEPAGEVCGALLYVHPFAEEMNKSRRMAALAAQAFADNGWCVLQVDLAGCGDSSGDFADASWAGWLADVDAAWGWLEARASGRTCLWSLRAGGLLLADWIRTRGVAAPWLLWQPVTDGRQHLTQFLRLKGVSQMLEEADAKAAMVAVRNALEGGQVVEVAGYALSPALVDGLQAATLDLPESYRGRIAALEVTPPDRGDISPALRRLAERWRGQGLAVTVAAHPGTAFWQTQEIETCPALIDASVAVLRDLAA